jgi:hypothetical protein
MPKWPNCGMKLAWNNLISRIYQLHLRNTTFSIGVWSLASLASPSILLLAKHAKTCGQLKYTLKSSYKSTKSFKDSMQAKKRNLKRKRWHEKTTNNVNLELSTSLKAWKKTWWMCYNKMGSWWNIQQVLCNKSIIWWRFWQLL